jgi:hypothetical protein
MEGSGGSMRGSAKEALSATPTKGVLGEDRDAAGGKWLGHVALLGGGSPSTHSSPYGSLSSQVDALNPKP